MQSYEVEFVTDQVAECRRSIQDLHDQQRNDVSAIVERLDALETRHVRYLRKLSVRGMQNRRYVVVCLLIGSSAFLQALPDTFFESKPAILSAIASTIIFILSGKTDGLLKQNFHTKKS